MGGLEGYPILINEPRLAEEMAEILHSCHGLAKRFIFVPTVRVLYLLK